MPDTKFEQCKRCPKCQEPGELINKFRHERGWKRRGMSTMHTFICRNERCRWFNDTWVVQVNDDGTIPERPKGEKEFPAPDRMIRMGQQYKEFLEEEVKRGETLGGL